VEGLLAVVGLEMTTKGVRTGTGTERWRERVPDSRVRLKACCSGHTHLFFLFNSVLICRLKKCIAVGMSRDGKRLFPFI